MLTTALSFYLVAALGDVVISLFLVQLFLWDPKWFPGKRASKTEVIFYDGGCGLCHKTILAVLEDERDKPIFNFSPLEGETFFKNVPLETRVGLPDSLLVLTDTGELLMKSRGIMHIGQRLGGLWRLGAALLWLIPLPIRDLGYDVVASVRKKIFATPTTACPLVPEIFQSKFLP